MKIQRSSMIRKLRETFRPESSYKAFFVTILKFALAHGLYKGIIDNYIAEAVGMSAFDKGVSEFFREMPGLALIFVACGSDGGDGGNDQDRRHEDPGDAVCNFGDRGFGRGSVTDHLDDL